MSIPGGDGELVPIVPFTPLTESRSNAQMSMKASTEPISIDACSANNRAGLSDADRQKLMAAARRCSAAARRVSCTFNLPGQELGTGNHHAFAALDPCKRGGDTGSTGIDCCDGF